MCSTSCPCSRGPAISPGELLDFHEARETARRLGPTLSKEKRPLGRASGLVLASAVLARNASPPFDNSAVDGFALGAPCGAGTRFELVSPIFAGDAAPAASLTAGTAAKVMTGAPVPAGTTCVAMQEDCTFEGSHVIVGSACIEGGHLRLRGEDFREGEPIAQRGSHLGPAMVGLLASDGCSAVDVFVMPRVGLLVTGNELTTVGNPLAPGHIYDSNTSAILAALRLMGCEEVVAEHVEDDLEKTREALGRLMATCPIVVTVGGLAVGERDFVPEALRQLGATPVFRRVAVKPGKPVSLFLTDECRVFCLPGNPLSALLMLYAFVRPALAEAMGIEACEDWTVTASLERITKKAGRAELVPGTLYEGKFRSTELRGSHLLRHASTAKWLALLEPDTEVVEAGEDIRVVRWEWGWG